MAASAGLLLLLKHPRKEHHKHAREHADGRELAHIPAQRRVVRQNPAAREEHGGKQHPKPRAGRKIPKRFLLSARKDEEPEEHRRRRRAPEFEHRGVKRLPDHAAMHEPGTRGGKHRDQRIDKPELALQLRRAALDKHDAEQHQHHAADLPEPHRRTEEKMGRGKRDELAEEEHRQNLADLSARQRGKQAQPGERGQKPAYAYPDELHVGDLQHARDAAGELQQSQ